MKFKYTGKSVIVFILLFCFSRLSAQVSLEGEAQTLTLNYLNPAEYEVGGITFSGASCDMRNLAFAVGDKIKIPGEKISKTIQRLSKMDIYKDNIRITATKRLGKVVFLDIYLEEMPRLKGFSYKGVKRGDIEEFEKKVSLSQGKVVNDNLKNVVKNIIVDYYVEKGFNNVDVRVNEEKDTSNSNVVSMAIVVDKGKKVHIDDINFYGLQETEPYQLRKSMKETKQRFFFKPFDYVDTAVADFCRNHERYEGKDLKELLSLYFQERVNLTFKASKFMESKYETDKTALIRKMNELGYRDAYIVKDSVYLNGRRNLDIDIYLSEGRRYYFRNITWVGNTKYSSEVLSKVLNISKGDVYNTTLLETNLSMNPEGMDVSSLYLDDGYLFFTAVPVEVKVEEDSIDVEIRVMEHSVVHINKVEITGNTRTGDEVILRELATVPGEKFRRSDVIRSQRQLLQMGYFNQEKMNVIPKTNEADGTVDLEYVVEETSSDQLEMSLGWGSNMFIASLGLTFNNFSFKKFFDKKAWNPIPSGDGQRLAFKIYANTWYKQFGASFTEPWLGGRNPNALTVSASYSEYNNNYAKTSNNYYGVKIFSSSVGLGKRLKWPDDYFSLSNTIGYMYYDVDNYPYFVFTDGYSNSLSYNLSVMRNSTDALIYPRNGSEFLLSAQFTPPYSLFRQHVDYAAMSDQEKYKWLEYHKWKFNLTYYLNVVDNLVLMVRGKYGFLGQYNPKMGYSPFERFYLGGGGLSSSFVMDGREIIGMRGYADESITPMDGAGNSVGGTVYQKMTFELRYPISLNPTATIYLLTFAEAGNCWGSFREYRPFSMYRSVGVGARIYLSMFGLLGLDWGYGFDAVPGNASANKGQFHFSLNNSID